MQNLHGLVLFICLICYTASPLCWEVSLPAAGGWNQAIFEPPLPTSLPEAVTPVPPTPTPGASPRRPEPPRAALPFPAPPGRARDAARGGLGAAPPQDGGVRAGGEAGPEAPQRPRRRPRRHLAAAEVTAGPRSPAGAAPGSRLPAPAPPPPRGHLDGRGGPRGAVPAVGGGRGGPERGRLCSGARSRPGVGGVRGFRSVRGVSARPEGCCCCCFLASSGHGSAGPRGCRVPCCTSRTRARISQALWASPSHRNGAFSGVSRGLIRLFGAVMTLSAISG